jgi:hypothetical protein
VVPGDGEESIGGVAYVVGGLSAIRPRNCSV